MSKTVDLNADMGESFGTWVMGNDTELLDLVTSANIACGFHAGDPDVMATTIRAARDRGVGIGAHPGFADLQGFGRQKMSLSDESLTNMIQYQLGAAQAMARANATQVRHLKLHGALANMAASDKALAMTCYRAALKVAPDIIVVTLAGTAQANAAAELKCHMASEIFADRAYNDDATLVDRSQPGAVIHDAKIASQRVVEMVRSGSIITQSGKQVPCQIDTICLHGDTPEAIEIAQSVRRSLEIAGVGLRRFNPI